MLKSRRSLNLFRQATVWDWQSTCSHLSAACRLPAPKSQPYQPLLRISVSANSSPDHRFPVINLFESLNQELSTRNVRRVAVFGTRFVIDSALFGFLNQVQVVSPRPDEVDEIHQVYSKLAQEGRGSEEQYRKLTGLAHLFCERDKADAILLAGTDLALMFNKSNTDFPHLDCAAVHIRAISDRLS